VRPPRGSDLTVETHVDLPAGASAVTQARRVVSDTLRSWGFDNEDWLDDVALVVTELVANAVRHAGGCRTVILHADGNRVTVTAVDTSPTQPHRREPDGGGGRGLIIIEALSTRWGVDHRHNGKRVWASFTPHHRRPLQVWPSVTSTDRDRDD